MTHRFLPTSVLRSVLLMSLFVAAYSGLAVWKENSAVARLADFPAGLEAVISLVMGLMLAFRANRAFDRWWEARTLWGTLVNACRNLAVKANNVVAQHDASYAELQRLLVLFPEALRDHLRGTVTDDFTAAVTGGSRRVEHLPAWVVNNIYGLIEVWKRDQRIQYGEFRMLDREAKVLLEVCGGCERIRNTPIAASYRVFLNHALAVFLLTMPWVVVNELGASTIAVTFLTAYFIIAAEAIADHIEQPFRADGDGLDLDGMCQAIRKSVGEIMETETPPGNS